MSATSQAIEHWHTFEHKRPLWSAKLVDFVQDDFPVAESVAVSEGEPVRLTCSRCDASVDGVSAHVIGSFLDAHNHCGEGLCDLWRCPECDATEFAERRHCRICEAPRSDDLFRGAITAPVTIRERYTVVRPGYGTAARYEVNSLREALRCARAQFPFESVAIQLGDRTWEVSHAAK